MKRYTFILVLFFFWTLAGQAQNPVDYEHLAYVKSHWREIENGSAAMEALILRADEALQARVVPVTEKTRVAASGDPHDYASMAPYSWPDPSKPDGLPYITRDGERNPELRQYDRIKIDGLSQTVNPLAYAYYFTGKEKYAEKAVSDLKKWFLDPETRMNPNFDYAQMVPGRNEGKGRAAGLIDGYSFIEIVDCIALLKGSQAMTEGVLAGLKQWFSDFADWFLTNPIGLQEGVATNNHSIAYDVQVAAYAGFAGRRIVVEEICRRFPSLRLFKQIEPDGSQPRELDRTMAMHYTIYNLDHMMDMEVLARRIGRSVLDVESSDGRSFAKALAFIAPYLGKPQDEFPYRQINDWEGNRQKLCWTLYRSTLFQPNPAYGEWFGQYNQAKPEEFNWIRFGQR